MSLRDQVALVTGAASGIGRALAGELARAGAVVVLLDVDADGVARAAADLTAAGARAEGLALDVTRADAFEAVVRDARARHGRVDLLFNVAGIGLVAVAHDLTPADWARVLDVNLGGVVHGVAAAYPLMVAQGRGQIVNVASLAGLVPTPGLVAYSASKHAVVGLSGSLREEARHHGVRVTCVCPGMVETPMLSRPSSFLNLDGPKLRERLLFGAITPEACARAILRAARRDRALVTVGGGAWFTYLLWRVAPWLVRAIARALARRLHEDRRRGAPALDVKS